MKIFISFLLLLLCCISTCFSSPLSISGVFDSDFNCLSQHLIFILCVCADGVFASEASIGRNLLQAKKPCPVNFEFMNYTIITSRCKGPQYPAKLCCDAFKDFACPYTDDLNDLSNDCASTMFSYINLYGNYPPGLFSSLCRDDKIGLTCPALAPGTRRDSVRADSNNSPNIHSLSMLTLTVGFVTFLLMWI